MILWSIAFACCFILIFIGQIMGWDTSGNSSIVLYCLMGACSLISLIILLYYLQFAIIDENGITIRGLFYRIAKIKWEDIAVITCEKIVTYDNRTNVFLSWLVVKCDKSEYVKGRAGRNRRNKSPWCIAATKRNKAIIGQYFTITYEQNNLV